jgi:hypothetical protein
MVGRADGIEGFAAGGYSGARGAVPEQFRPRAGRKSVRARSQPPGAAVIEVRGQHVAALNEPPSARPSGRRGRGEQPAKGERMTRFVVASLLTLGLGVGLVNPAVAKDAFGKNNPKKNNGAVEGAKLPAKLDDPKKTENDVVPQDENPPPKKDKDDYTPPKKDHYTPPKKDNYNPPKKNNNYTPKKNNYAPKRNNYNPPKKDDYTPPKKDDYTPPKKEYYPPAKPACTYKKVVCYRPVTCYEYRQEPYTKYVTKYDHCGYPYSCEVTCYRSVRVAVTKYRPYVKYVKVCSSY